MKIRGKKINSTQRAILINAGIINPDEYLYVKMETVNLGDGRRLNRDCPRIEKMVIIHRETGKTKRVTIKEV